jgi:acyl-CoA hydrolase
MEVVLTQLMGACDAGAPGRVHGGTILRLCDEAANIAAARHSRLHVTTAGVERVSFKEPIYVGEVLTFAARVNAVWRTSAEVGVRVTAEELTRAAGRHVVSAYFTIVAIGEDGAPSAMPSLEPRDEQARRREREANARRAARVADAGT